MANGMNTALALGGAGFVSGILPADAQTGFNSAVQYAANTVAPPVGTAPPPPVTAPVSKPDAAAFGPSVLDRLMSFARSPLGKGVAVLAVLGLGYKLYKGRR